MDTLNHRFAIVTPGGTMTGGPEALHQLADSLNRIRGVEALTFYTPPRNESIIAFYKKAYPAIREINGAIPAGSTLIVSENQDPSLWSHFDGFEKWIWWLSAERRFPLRAYDDWGHLFQSEHAKQQLQSLGFEGLMVTDYISDLERFAPHRQKTDLVVINGSKSAVMAARLRLCFPELRMLPLHGLNPAEISLALDEAKIYVDFGWHPGRDRLPREAALHHCLIVTGRLGSAKNTVDLPIPVSYKVSDYERVESIGLMIKELLNTYERRLPEFAAYREWIAKQKAVFAAEVAHFVQVHSSFESRHFELCATAELLDERCLEMQEALLNSRASAIDLASRAQRALTSSPVRFRIMAAASRAAWWYRRTTS
jgi:hypothetical protein